MPSSKPRIAILDLTGCTGCEVNLLRLGADFLDMAQDFEIVTWRMVQEEEETEYDIVFVDGYACNEKQVEQLKKARETAAVVVALGACAISGNVFSQLTPENYEKMKALVYSPEHQAITQFVKPVPEVVKVDYTVPGCPARVEVAQSLLAKLREEPARGRKLVFGAVRRRDYLAKIEGHGSLQVNFAEGTARFYPSEGERFVEGLVAGKPYGQAPLIHSRICGICPVAHAVCSILALERALGVHPSHPAIRLRKLFACGQMVQSHLLHLYFMVLPSQSGLTSGVEMSKAYPAEFHLYLNIKRLCEKLFELIGGAPLQPVTLTVGGFTKVPDVEELLAIGDQILDVLDEAEDLASLFAGFPWPAAETECTRLSLQPDLADEYPLFGRRVLAGTPEPLPVKKYRDFLVEEIPLAHPGKVGYLAPKVPVKTGALARMFHHRQRLQPLAAGILDRTSVDFTNPFHNSLAQAIEIVNYLEQALCLINKLAGDELAAATVHPKEVNVRALAREGAWPQRGVAAIEAPRGLLFHDVHIEKNGTISAYNIIAPTGINLSGLEQEAALLVRSYQAENDERKIDLLEDLIRAIDPCITCAVH
jgi:sulfhydrogenase subunit alpha